MVERYVDSFMFRKSPVNLLTPVGSGQLGLCSFIMTYELQIPYRDKFVFIPYDLNSEVSNFL